MFFEVETSGLFSQCSEFDVRSRLKHIVGLIHIKTKIWTERTETLSDSLVLEAEHKPAPDNYIPIQSATMKTTNQSYSGNPVLLGHQLRWKIVSKW